MPGKERKHLGIMFPRAQKGKQPSTLQPVKSELKLLEKRNTDKLERTLVGKGKSRKSPAVLANSQKTNSIKRKHVENRNELLAIERGIHSLQSLLNTRQKEIVAIHKRILDLESLKFAKERQMQNKQYSRSQLLLFKRRQIAAIRRQIDTLKQQMDKKKKDITALKVQMEVKKQRMAFIKKHMDAKSGQMNDIKQRMAAKKIQMKAIKKRMDTKKGQMRAIRKQMDPYKRQMELIKSRMDAKKQQISTIQNDIPLIEEQTRVPPNPALSKKTKASILLHNNNSSQRVYREMLLTKQKTEMLPKKRKSVYRKQKKATNKKLPERKIWTLSWIPQKQMLPSEEYLSRRSSTSATDHKPTLVDTSSSGPEQRLLFYYGGRQDSHFVKRDNDRGDTEDWVKTLAKTYNFPVNTEVIDDLIKVIRDGMHQSETSRWSEWGPFSECKESCGGQQSRARFCISLTGDRCKGNSLEVQPCEPCEGSAEAHPYTGDEWSHWSPWSQCSVTCAMGLLMRSRSCPGQKCRGPSTETRYCVQQSCVPVDRGAVEKITFPGITELKCRDSRPLIRTENVYWVTPLETKISADTSWPRFTLAGNSLVINGVQDLDGGTYHCVLAKEDGTIETSDFTLYVSMCEENHCQHGGTCVQLVEQSIDTQKTRFRCLCPLAYAGENCEKKNNRIILLAATSVLSVLVLVACTSCVLIMHRNRKTPPVASSKTSKDKKFAPKKDSKFWTRDSDKKPPMLEQKAKEDTGHEYNKDQHAGQAASLTSIDTVDETVPSRAAPGSRHVHRSVRRGGGPISPTRYGKQPSQDHRFPAVVGAQPHYTPFNAARMSKGPRKAYETDAQFETDGMETTRSDRYHSDSQCETDRTETELNSPRSLQHHHKKTRTVRVLNFE